MARARRRRPVADRHVAAARAAERYRLAIWPGQQFRAAEVRAKLGGIGAYAPPRTEKPAGPPFVLKIIFSDREATRIEGNAEAPR
jgi:hypothetical protein